MRFRFLPWNLFFFCFFFNFFFSFLERLWWMLYVTQLKLPDVVGILYSIFTQRFEQIIVIWADNACWMFTFNTNVVPFLLVSLIPLESFVTPVIYDLGHVTVLRLCCRPPMRNLVINEWQRWGYKIILLTHKPKCHKIFHPSHIRYSFQQQNTQKTSYQGSS